MAKKIEVVYASPTQQELINFEVPENCSVIDAIKISGILEQFPEIDLNKNKVGIFGKIVELNALAAEGDRIEIYYPLLIDPKEARKSRAKKQKHT